MENFVTPKQVARAIGASESSLKRWCDNGLIPSLRTAGGHRRMPISGVLAYLRSNQQDLVAPELLGLPASCGKSGRIVDRGRERLLEGLLAGDEDLCSQIVTDIWLSGQSLSRICDQVIAAAFTDIGEKWACHEADVYQERRACEIVLRILHELRGGLPPGDPAWLAIGGTLEGDQYTLPTTMVETVLQETGLASRSLGSSIPFASLALAIRDNRPRLAWVSVSFIADPACFLREFPALNAAADEVGAALVVGGFALQGCIRQQLRYSAFCDTMQHVEQFAKALRGAGR